MEYVVFTVSFFLGYYQREVLNYLKAIYTKLSNFNPDKPTPTDTRDSFVEPMTRGEVMQMLEKERIDMLNK